MKHLYSINILNHPYIKTADDVKNLINILNKGNNLSVNPGESYIIRRTLSNSWVWDKMTRTPVDIVGRLYGNQWTERFNQENYDENLFEVGRNPNKGFLMIDNTLWGLCKFDNSIKGRNLKRLNIPHEIIENICNKVGFNKPEKYQINNLIYYVDNLTPAENLLNISKQFNQIIVNFDESFKIPIYISNIINSNLDTINDE